MFMPAGTYLFGIIANASGMSGAAADGTSGNYKRSPDTYSDGAAATFGTITAFGATFRAYIPYSLNGP